jgi:predicted acylesterase/phospholipase RssA
MGIESKLEFFAETRHSYGRTALLLSGGASFGKFHFGVLKALWEQDLFPKIVCGSSVGSLILAGFCCLPKEDVLKFFDGEYVFKNPILGFHTESKSAFLYDLLAGKVTLDTETLKKFAKNWTGDLTFKDVYQKYGWNLNVSVTDHSTQ